MAPAFSSTKEAAVFALLLLVLLLLPALMAPSLLPSREQVYSTNWWDNGAFPYIEQQIFMEKGDIDIAFLGASHMQHGMEPFYVQERLSEKLGRPAVVRSLFWGVGGNDALYFIARDLLEHRKVRLLVFYDSYDPTVPDAAHRDAPYWFRFGDNAGDLQGLPWNLQASYYFAAIVGMPRNLLGLMRFDLPADLFPSKQLGGTAARATKDFATRLRIPRNGFAQTPESKREPFEPFLPDASANFKNVFTYSEANGKIFNFTDACLPPLQLHFARKFARLAEEHQTKLVLLHIPILADRREPVIRERAFWPELLQSDLALIGIPEANLFEKMNDDEVRKLFENPTHLNRNGQLYFTSLITPKLIKIYETETNR